MNTWQVTVDLDTARPLSGDALDLVVDALEANAAALSWLGVELSISMTIETSGSPTRAGELAVRAATTAVRGAGTNVAGWRGVEALTADEADRRLTEPAIPKLVGTPEAGQVLLVCRGSGSISCAAGTTSRLRLWCWAPGRCGRGRVSMLSPSGGCRSRAGRRCGE